MLKKYIISFIISTTLLFSITKDEIKSTMSKNIEAVLNILKQNKLTHEEKAKEIILIMNENFDYELMSRLSLGKKWKELDSNKQNNFIKLFEKVLKDSYIDKLNLYTNEKVKIIGLQEPKKNRAILNTEIVGKSDNYQIDYKFYQKTKEDWKIYDVSLAGVSIIQTYRQQFAGFLKDKTFDELVNNLKNKINDKKSI
ncbi:toluene tolerance protein [Halarcobacter mediterraneus]|uniref:Toluene tolerance protein n=1 Tax=Halarcobacter mediterraneus TaxID=2023153 RepID=A0A4Q1AY04_9BACT|nr:ABC transporter substrate-binding protein [Halarcobacter mediterraneus]RXK13900.1 toluene tolerance protein [Halarcobacter mediterraneus]